jgi:serine/threonine protein kinase
VSQTIQESRWVGRVLREKWRIDGKIARGGMGTVFAATHRNNGSRAAIKILHPEFSRDQDTRGRFLQEGYAANQVNHPGVVRILDDDVTEEGYAYLVMELLAGELLEQRRIRFGGRLPLDEVFEIADQLLDVLASAHDKGIVHRDVKPDNIFLTQHPEDRASFGRVKILDFGFAQMKSGFRKEQTATGFLLGTPGFMAPEQASGRRQLIDAQTDLWSVGATLFLLLTGQPVHAGEAAAELLVAAANYPVRSITTLESHLPTKLSFLVDRALAFEKSDRWPDARAMQKALRSVPGRGSPRAAHADTLTETYEDLGSEELRQVSAHISPSSDTEAHAADQEDPTRYLENTQRAPHPADEEKATIARPATPLSPTTKRSAEDDGPTIARPSPRRGIEVAVPAPSTRRDHPMARAPSTPPPRLHDLDHDLADPSLPIEGTVVMQSRPPNPRADTTRVRASHPSHHDAVGVGAAAIRVPDSYVPAPPAAFQLPQPQPQPPLARPPHPQHPAHVVVPSTIPRRASMPAHDELEEHAPAGAKKKVFVFLLVAGGTAVLVILTGLVIILGLE